MADDKTNEPIPFADILAEKKPQVDKPKIHRGFPTGAGNTGISMGKQPTYDRDDPYDENPSGATVGARNVQR